VSTAATMRLVVLLASHSLISSSVILSIPRYANKSGSLRNLCNSYIDGIKVSVKVWRDALQKSVLCRPSSPSQRAEQQKWPDSHACSCPPCQSEEKKKS